MLASFVSSEASLLALQIAVFLLCPHMVFCQSLFCLGCNLLFFLYNTFLLL